jgi:hypothetical protein
VEHRHRRNNGQSFVDLGSQSSRLSNNVSYQTVVLTCATEEYQNMLTARSARVDEIVGRATLDARWIEGQERWCGAAEGTVGSSNTPRYLLRSIPVPAPAKLRENPSSADTVTFVAFHTPGTKTCVAAYLRPARQQQVMHTADREFESIRRNPRNVPCDAITSRPRHQ